MSRSQRKSKGEGIPKTLEWEQFKLKERVTCRLLNLCTIGTLFIMGVIGFLVWHGSDISATAIGALIPTAVAGILKLSHFLAKQTKE